VGSLSKVLGTKWSIKLEKETGAKKWSKELEQEA